LIHCQRCGWGINRSFPKHCSLKGVRQQTNWFAGTNTFVQPKYVLNWCLIQVMAEIYLFNASRPALGPSSILVNGYGVQYTHPETDHSLPLSAELRMCCVIPLYFYIFMTRCLIKH
jgi:hypothetical protein